ncbi:MAG: SUF system NifU family Fe-S cluster assembly protein [Deltaproteobacteria bacterium]|nr:SUF system NifU family Fe-S cluster assembly protein [Deltaproteobacteria bacterium]
MSLEELFKEIIIEHYQHPKNHGHIEHPDARSEGSNPLCGDEIQMELLFEGDRIKDVMFTGNGCSISQSAASLMTEAIKGRTVAEARRLMEEYKNMLQGNDYDAGMLGDLEALSDVKKFPARVKCASLSMAVLDQALQQKK